VPWRFASERSKAIGARLEAPNGQFASTYPREDSPE
jgi:hypothetical protein